MRRPPPAAVALAAMMLAPGFGHSQAVAQAARSDTAASAAAWTTLPALQAPVFAAPVFAAPIYETPVFGDLRGAGAGGAQQRELPRRQTRRFATWGAVGGAAAGALVGGWMALYCSSTTSDHCWPIFPLMTGFGAAAGGIGGAIIGAAVPGPGARGPAEPIGSGQLSVGFARGSVAGLGLPGADGMPDAEQAHTGSGITARVNVYAELTPWLAIGPEAGIARLGGDAGDVRHVAVAARFSASRRQVMPFATIHLGAYDSTRPSLEYLGAGIGAGARIMPGGSDRFFLDAEARYARNAQNIEPMRMGSLSVSGGLYW